MILINSKGQRNPTSKLNWKLVDKIRKEYKTGELNQQELAKKYKISTSTLGRVIRMESWVR